MAVADTLQKAHDSCVHSVREQHLRIPGARELLGIDLSRYGTAFVFGIAIQRSFNGSAFELHLLIPKDAPYSLPRVALFGLDKEYIWPHVESKSILCLHDQEGVYVDHARYADACTHLLMRASILVEESLKGVDAADFRKEWLSYWRMKSDSAAPPVHLLLPRASKSTLAKSILTAKGWIIASTDAATKRLAHVLGIAAGNYEIGWAAVLSLNAAPVPVEYPSTVDELLALSGEQAFQDSVQKAITRNGATACPWVLSVESESVLTYAAGVIVPPAIPSRRGRWSGVSYQPSLEEHLSRGFRGLPPWPILKSRMSKHEVSLRQSHRYDHAWVHGRGLNVQSQRLAEKRVIIFGVGSLGSGVAELLAKSGVGNITFVDPEIMESENASRHLLGCGEVGDRKAEAVALRLQRNFPDSEFTSFNGTAHDFVARRLGDTPKSDLVLSLSGSGGCDFLIEDLRESGVLPIVVYGWLEAHCMAGHAVRAGVRPGCLRCLLNPEDGQPVLPVSIWEEESRKGVPACGGMFQPYGAIDLARVQALVAQLAVDTLLSNESTSRHRVWLGETERVVGLGGRWNPSWEQRHFSIGTGSREATIEFGSGCGHCNQ